MLLAIIYGTRPEFLKLKVLIDIIRQRQSDKLRVIKIEQHTALLGDEDYYDEVLKMEQIATDRIHNIGCNILQKLPTMLHSVTHILVQGDTASVFYATLCAFQLKKKIIHLEAGMRTYDLENPYPEEGYRQMVSRLANIHLCPSEEEAKNLVAENIAMPQNIHVIGNTILDLVKSYGNEVSYDKKVLITLHRRENWSSYKSLVEEIYKLAAIEKMSEYEFYFIIHMNPSLQGIIDELKIACPKNMNIIAPLDHKSLIGLLSSCEFVITDSGGIQEEANFLGKHMYVLRKVTERNSISDVNLTLLDQDKIGTIEPGRIGVQGYEYGRGDSCEKTYEILFA